MNNPNDPRNLGPNFDPNAGQSEPARYEEVRRDQTDGDGLRYAGSSPASPVPSVPVNNPPEDRPAQGFVPAGMTADEWRDFQEFKRSRGQTVTPTPQDRSQPAAYETRWDDRTGQQQFRPQQQQQEYRGDTGASSYGQNMYGSAPEPQATAAPRPVTFSGAPSVEYVTIRENLRRGGVMLHDIAIETDGWGHFRVQNMDPSHEWHPTRDAAINAALDANVYEGDVQLHKADDRE